MIQSLNTSAVALLRLLLFLLGAAPLTAQVPCVGESSPHDLFNVTAGGRLSQSSIFEDGHPERVIDGQKSGNWATGNAARTEWETEPWWAIDLGQSYALESLRLWYPADVYPTGCSDYYLLYSRYPFETNDLHTELASPTVGYLHVAGAYPSGTAFPLGQVSAQYLRIQKVGEGVLSLLEIEVPGSFPEVCGNGCDDDRDGWTDCEDDDCRPTLYNVTTRDPSCPICPDGEISIQAFGEDLQFSVDGGQTYEAVCDQLYLCRVGGLTEGDYEVVVRQEGACTVAWSDHPIVLRAPPGDPQEDCENGGFEEGTFEGWEGARGEWVGNEVVMNLPGIVTGRHSIINARINNRDLVVRELDLTPPSGGSYIAKLGNTVTGARAERLTYCFEVDANNQQFRFFYLPVMEDPGHRSSENPFFQYRFLNSAGELISGQRSIADEDDPFFQTSANGLVYRTWTCVETGLGAYLGEEVCLEFTTADCQQGGHYGYAYVDALCNGEVAPVPALDVGPYLCSCGSNDFWIDGSGSTGENRYAWRVCKLTEGGAAVGCRTTFGYNDVGGIDLKDFYEGQGGDWECGATYRVLLSVTNDCGEARSLTRDVTAICDLIVDYPDFIYCTEEEVVPIQGINTCENCIFEWTVSDQGIIDDASKPFPNIVAFPPGGGGELDLSIVATDPLTGCVCGDEVKVKRVGQPRIIDLRLEQLDPCSGYIQARFWGNASFDLLTYELVDEDGTFFAGEIAQNPNNPNMYIVTYPYSEGEQALMENTTYTFTLGVRSGIGPLRDFESYNCTDSEHLTVGGLYYYGDFPSLYFPDFNPFSPVPDNSEMIVFAPESTGYNAYYYKLTIFEGDTYNGIIYEKEERLTSTDPPFHHDHIRWDGKIRTCYTSLIGHSQCYPEIENSVPPVDGECVNGQNSFEDRIPCNDSYWDENDGLNVCFDQCGFPRFYLDDTYTYTLRLINCTGEKLYSGAITISTQHNED